MIPFANGWRLLSMAIVAEILLMLIKREILEAIKSGEITLQFRRWRRRSVKAGGTLKTKVGVLQIGTIEPILAQDVTESDAQRAGFKNVADFLKWLDTMKQGELDRIEVSYKGELDQAD